MPAPRLQWCWQWGTPSPTAASTPSTLIQHRLDAERLASSLGEQHVQQTAGLSDDEQAVYRRLLVETCRRIVYVANHVAGYGPLVDRHTLLTLDLVLYNLAQLVAGLCGDA